MNTIVVNVFMFEYNCIIMFEYNCIIFQKEIRKCNNFSTLDYSATKHKEKTIFECLFCKELVAKNYRKKHKKGISRN